MSRIRSVRKKEEKEREGNGARERDEGTLVD